MLGTLLCPRESSQPHGAERAGAAQAALHRGAGDERGDLGAGRGDAGQVGDTRLGWDWTWWQGVT